MAWTYETMLGSDKDKVRLLIGDTDAGQPLLSDEELAYCLTQAGVTRAAAKACRAIAAKFARDATTAVAGFSATLQSRHEQYLKLAEILEAAGSEIIAVPTAGGIEQSENEAAAADTSLVPRLFRVGAMDNPPGLAPRDERLA